jgi:hypothetical protein
LLNKLLIPPISATILITITVAAIISNSSSTASASFYLINYEDLRITGCMWASDVSYANITVSNFGSNTVSINEVKLDSAAADYTFVSGDSTVDAGETVAIHVSGFFEANVSHQFSVVSSGGTGFVFVGAAPEPSSIVRMEPGIMENVTEEVTQVDVDEDVSVGGSVSSNQRDYFVESDFETYTDPPETVVRHVFQFLVRLISMLWMKPSNMWRRLLRERRCSLIILNC